MCTGALDLLLEVVQVVFRRTSQKKAVEVVYWCGAKLPCMLYLLKDMPRVTEVSMRAYGKGPVAEVAVAEGSFRAKQTIPVVAADSDATCTLAATLG